MPPAIERIAITGATGFIGRHLLAAIAGRDIEAIAVARSLEHAPPAAGANIRWVELDLGQPAAGDFARIGRPQALIHLAWEGLPNYGSAHHIEAELPKHFRFLEGLVQSGLPSMLVAGTCLEYGMQSGELSEATPARPALPYAVAKDRLRARLEDLQKELPFSLTWARLFYLYGEGQRANALYSLLGAAVKRGDAQFPMSRGDQVRDYLPVEEAARALLELALRQPGAGIVNVCSGRPVTVHDLIQSWLRERRWRIELETGALPYPEYEPFAFWGDRRRMDRLLAT